MEIQFYMAAKSNSTIKLDLAATDPVFFRGFLSWKAEEGGPAFLHRRSKVFGVYVLTIRG
jgi:hypothetical protein